MNEIPDSHRGSCRFCGTPLAHTFVDLGMSPLCENFLSAEQLNEVEAFYPLYVWVCDSCFLVQLLEYVSPGEIFADYAYFSSFSDSWLRHARRYTEFAKERFHLDGDSLAVEIASNDGYLLRNFVEMGVPVLGVEPAANVAQAAVDKGVPTEVRFFGKETAAYLVGEGKSADLLIGNNVLAHVPDINDFVAGLAILLAPEGVITMEFPHLMRLMEDNQFDTIYHEHFSYLSFLVTRRIFEAHGLTLFDVEELPSHGGSLRIFARHAEYDAEPVTDRVRELEQRETAAGLKDIAHYATFTEKVEKTKRELLSFLISARSEGKRVAAYGAPGKGNTLLNYCGIRTDLLDYAVDRNPFKHGKFLPGTHIPVHPTERIRETRPDFVLILPWNLEKEITAQLAYIREWGGRFVIPIPEVRVKDPAPEEVSSLSEDT